MSRDFKIQSEPVDVTYGGIFGGEPDRHRRAIAGAPRYLIDGVSVTRDVYETEYRKDHQPQTWADIERAALFDAFLR